MDLFQESKGLGRDGLGIFEGCLHFIENACWIEGGGQSITFFHRLKETIKFQRRDEIDMRPNIQSYIHSQPRLEDPEFMQFIICDDTFNKNRPFQQTTEDERLGNTPRFPI